MPVHIVIDGYNLIRCSPALAPIDRKDLELGRDALVQRLAAYKRLKGHQITVVFDGAAGYFGFEKSYTEKGIKIRFSRPGETADAVIRQIASREKSKVLVVSSDRAVTDFSASQGAATISAAGFEQKLEMAAFMEVKGADASEKAGEERVLTTKKKGPGKRLSKKNRKNQKKLLKL